MERLIYTDEGAFVSLYEDERSILSSLNTAIVAEKSFRPFGLTRISQFVSYLPASPE